MHRLSIVFALGACVTSEDEPPVPPPPPPPQPVLKWAPESCYSTLHGAIVKLDAKNRTYEPVQALAAHAFPTGRDLHSLATFNGGFVACQGPFVFFLDERGVQQHELASTCRGVTGNNEVLYVATEAGLHEYHAARGVHGIPATPPRTLEFFPFTNPGLTDAGTLLALDERTRRLFEVDPETGYSSLVRPTARTSVIEPFEMWNVEALLGVEDEVISFGSGSFEVHARSTGFVVGRYEQPHATALSGATCVEPRPFAADPEQLGDTATATP